MANEEYHDDEDERNGMRLVDAVESFHLLVSVELSVFCE